jgi:hypothetical protein
MQHELFKLALDGKLNLAPVSNPLSVLDIGTGTGIWAVEFGEQVIFFTGTIGFLALLTPLALCLTNDHSNTISFRKGNWHGLEPNTASIVSVPKFGREALSNE